MIEHGKSAERDELASVFETPITRRRFMGKAAAMGLALPALDLVTPAAPAAAARSKPKGQIVFASAMSDLADLHPFTARLSRATAVSYHVNEGLTKLAPDLTIVPGLATSWHVSHDELTYTFTLRKGVKWHDGKSFTGEDVKFTLGQALAYTSQSPAKTLDKYVRRIRVKGDRVTIMLREPYSPLLTLMATQLQILPAHLLRGNLYDADFRKSPIGTGPYTVASRTGDSLTLAANPRYWGPAPYTSRIVLKDAPSTAAQQAGLLAGELDVVAYVPTAMGGLRTQQGYRVYGGAATSVHGICLNLQNPILSDVRVRQALALALDRTRIKQLWYTDGILADSYVSSAFGRYHDTKLAKIEQNLTQAAKLLDQAGWQKGSDGMRSKGGTPLQLTHYAWPAQQWQDIAAIAQASWKKIGVDVKIVSADNSRIATIISGDYDVAPLGLGLTNDPVYGLNQLLHTTSSTFKEGGTFNVFHYSNRQVDALIDRAIGTADPARRIGLVDQVQVRGRNDLPFIPIAYPAYELITKRNVVLHERNKGLSGIGVGYFMNKWRVS